MDRKLLIFDMDGTLLDSMNYWRELGRIYLKLKGKSPEDDLEEKIESMTLQESASYLREKYDLKENEEQIQEEVMSLIEDKYKNEIPLKKGAKSYLDKMKKCGYRMCILTTCEKNNAISALKRLQILDFFEQIYTDKDFKVTKKSPKIYIEVCEKMNSNPYETTIYEDAPYAIKAAKNTECKVVGVYDDFYKQDWNKIKSMADCTIENYN